ncbi:RNase adapter RapZ [Pseudokineococcus sp. 5B2Z-1]|uniref:RNase adapter RapZ n=1 Tax=Pseudokineococcus sp. 5B2Z-1 TaxID=3132744 RepID=UPI0030A7BB1F
MDATPPPDDDPGTPSPGTPPPAGRDPRGPAVRPGPRGNLEETGEVPVLVGDDPPGWSAASRSGAARAQVPVPAAGSGPRGAADGADASDGADEDGAPGRGERPGGVDDGAGDAGEGAPPGASEGGTEVLVVTGMSGAGRSTVADRLEDLGWYVVDNLPPQMLSALAGLAARARRGLPRVAVVLDVRGQEFFPEVQSALEELRDRGIVVRVLFLEASDEALVRRFESVRRPHPLQGEGRILDGIRAERELVAALRGGADLLVDTSSLNVHELGARVGDVFGEAGRPRLRVTVMSFGFKYGIPVDADHVADVRFLPNPYWEPSLRAQTGRDEGVRDFVLRQEGAEEWLDRYVAALEPVVAGYRREHRGFVTVAVGCTGGKHRSVALSEQLARRLSGTDVRARVVHRDLGRE